jgi:hypothetical protein
MKGRQAECRDRTLSLRCQGVYRDAAKIWHYGEKPKTSI